MASSPLITGDPDVGEEKYRRRAPTDWFLRWDCSFSFPVSTSLQVVEDHDEACSPAEKKFLLADGCSSAAAGTCDSGGSLQLPGQVRNFLLFPDFSSQRV